MRTQRSTTDGALPPILSTRQCADYAGVDIKSIYRLIEKGDLPAVRFGPRCMRIRREDLLALLTPATKDRRRAAGRS
jgi:excisionase family DNA binding protein